MLGDRYEHLGCDRDVRVGRTMLTGADGQRLKMFGAFAGRDFMPFEFLGFYTGDLVEFEDGKSQLQVRQLQVQVQVPRELESRGQS